MSERDIESIFPNLPLCGYSITSPATPEYNCIAWAAADTESWWEPDPYNLSFWPTGVPRAYTLEAYVKAYNTRGYVVCDNFNREDDFEKIAIYIDASGKPTHAARQLTSGRWTSKLGQLEDIEHHTLDGLTGNDYGIVAALMKRHKL